MPSENVVRDRRKKARTARTARIEGTGFQRGMAPDFVYGKDEPNVIRPLTEVGERVMKEAYDLSPGEVPKRAKFRNDAKMARRLFELQRQRVPGVFPKRKKFGQYDLTESPKGMELINTITQGLKKNHPDVYNPYTEKEEYEPFSNTSNTEEFHTDPSIAISEIFWKHFGDDFRRKNAYRLKGYRY